MTSRVLLSMFLAGVATHVLAVSENISLAVAEVQPPTSAPIREAMIVAPQYVLESPPAENEPCQRQGEVSSLRPNEPCQRQGEVSSLRPIDDDQAVSSADTELTALPEEDVWQRIRNGFAMNDLDSPLIKRHEKWYASHPDYILRMSERAQRYLFYITEEVERRGMPAEIALLPIIESAFNPGANSVARASGIWQFIPSTGKHFGMEQNWWYDGRRDIIGATNGALDYLQKLYNQFGDWHLALAAYNWGENAVARAQASNRKRGKPTDYAHLKMPRETRNYVPKLLAIKRIVSDPARFGLTLRAIQNRPYFAAVKLSQAMDVKIAAEMAEISMEEFLALNPGHNRPVILHDQAEVLLLPADKVETFRNNLKKSDQRMVSWRAYVSKKGESFADIARRHNIPLDQLRAANGLSRYAMQSNGQTLLVPADGEYTSEEFSPFNLHATAVQEMSGLVYVVRKGDTISAIARKFRVSQSSLIAMNKNSHRLRIGQRFTILPGSSGKSAIRRVSGSRSAKRNMATYRR